MTVATVGIDLGKNSCSLAALDATRAVVLRRRLSRGKLVEFVGRLPACVVAMEAWLAVRITSGGCLRRKATRCG